MKSKITKRLVDEIEAGDKPVFVFDTEVAGFVLKVTPAGHRTYQIRYRMGGRATPLKTYTLGKHGALTPDQARRLAQAVLGDVRRGIDPAEEKAKKAAEDRGAASVATLSKEFLSVYGETKLKPRSLVEYQRYFKQRINPIIGSLKVRDVKHKDVERLHHGLRSTPATGNRTVSALSKFFSWAIRGGYRPDRQNPCKGLEKFKEAPRKRYLSPAEIAAVGDAIRRLEGSKDLEPQVAAYFRILLLTGMRRDELRTMEWARVDFNRAVFLLEDEHSKVGARELPIPAPVLQILARITRVESNSFVFPGQREKRPIVNVAKPWARILKAAGIEPARVHDLRHTAASVGVASGASLPLIGGVLGHSSAKTTQRYAHLSADPVRQTAETIATQVAESLEGKRRRRARRALAPASIIQQTLLGNRALTAIGDLPPQRRSRGSGRRGR
jgi:integrase